MDSHTDIPPSNSGLTQSSNPFGNGGGNESDIGAAMSPVWNSLPPLPTSQPSECGSMDFIPSHSPSTMYQPSPEFPLPPMSPSSSPLLYYPSAPVDIDDMTFPPMLNTYVGGSSSSLSSPSFSLPAPAPVLNKDMAFPPMPNAYVGGSGSSMPSPASAVLRSAPVVNKDRTLPPIPFSRLNSSSEGSSLPPRDKDHVRGNSDTNISRLNSLLAAQKQRIYPRTIQMAVGVRSQNEVTSDMGVNVENVNNISLGVKRRAGNEIAPPSGIWRSVSVDSSLNGMASELYDTSAFGGQYTASELKQIALCDKLKAKAESNPKYVKRTIANRASAARSKDKKERIQSELADKVVTFDTQISTLTDELNHVKGEKLMREEENARLRIRLDGMEKQARLHEEMIQNLTGQVRRQAEELSRLTSEVSEHRRRETERLQMEANMFQQLNINNQFHDQPQN